MNLLWVTKRKNSKYNTPKRSVSLMFMFLEGDSAVAAGAVCNYFQAFSLSNGGTDARKIRSCRENMVGWVIHQAIARRICIYLPRPLALFPEKRYNEISLNESDFGEVSQGYVPSERARKLPIISSSVFTFPIMKMPVIQRRTSEKSFCSFKFECHVFLHIVLVHRNLSS